MSDVSDDVKEFLAATEPESTKIRCEGCCVFHMPERCPERLWEKVEGLEATVRKLREETKRALAGKVDGFGGGGVASTGFGQ